MRYDRRDFLKKVGLFLFVLFTPLLVILNDLKAPTTDVEEYKKHLGLEDDGDQPLPDEMPG